MSRSGYSDDCEHLNLWRANVDRTIRGKRGQAFLRELRQALEDMPVKRLIGHALIEAGEVCAIGAVGLRRKIDMDYLDPEDAERVGSVFGISPMLAQEIVYMNDERYWNKTPEERWTRMYAWVQNQIQEPSEPGEE